jgi:hypothetical protein
LGGVNAEIELRVMPSKDPMLSQRVLPACAIGKRSKFEFCCLQHSPIIVYLLLQL